MDLLYLFKTLYSATSGAACPAAGLNRALKMIESVKCLWVGPCDLRALADVFQTNEKKDGDKLRRPREQSYWESDGKHNSWPSVGQWKQLLGGNKRCLFSPGTKCLWTSCCSINALLSLSLWKILLLIACARLFKRTLPSYVLGFPLMCDTVTRLCIHLLSISLCPWVDWGSRPRSFVRL